MDKGKANVAMITGANSGVGFGLLNTLASSDWTIVCACRSKGRADSAISQVKARHPQADIHFLQIDVSDPKSVMKAAAEYKTRFGRLDALFLNAGIFPTCGLDISGIIERMMSLGVVKFFETGGMALRQPVGLKTTNGMGEVFAANVFGHFLLLNELTTLLEKANPGKVIWTGSRAARKNSFSWNDIQCISGVDAYGSSKYVVDVLNHALNKRLNKKNVYSYTTCPGFVFTNIFAWLNNLIYPFVMIMSLLLENFTVTPETGSRVLFELLKRNPADTDVGTKYCLVGGTACRPQRRLGTTEFGGDFTDEDAERMYEYFSELASRFRE